MRLWSVKVFTEGISILWCNCDIERELHNWQGLTRGHISVCYSSVHFQHKGPVMKRIFPCHDIIILKINCTIGRGWLGAYANMSSLCANEREPGSAVGNKEWWKKKPTFGWYASFDVLPQISVRNLFCVWYIPQNIDIVSEMEMVSFWCLFTAPDIVKMTHYSDVIMGATASQITSLTLFSQRFIQTQIKGNIKAPRHWPFWGEFTGDWWIPCTNGQLRGKCFHLMTS